MNSINDDLQRNVFPAHSFSKKFETILVNKLQIKLQIFNNIIVSFHSELIWKWEPKLRIMWYEQWDNLSM